jgi:hypothetical protein
MLIALPFTVASQAPAVAATQPALTQQPTSPLAGGDIAEKKGSPKWCQKHPKKCARMGGVPM